LDQDRRNRERLRKLASSRSLEAVLPAWVLEAVLRSAPAGAQAAVLVLAAVLNLEVNLSMAAVLPAVPGAANTNAEAARV
jgi:hypothetical protein